MEYDEGYFLRGEGSNYGGKGYAPYTRQFFLPEAMKLAIKIQDIFNPKSVLDIGCGRGYLVMALDFLKINTIGIDISKWAIDNCELGIKDKVSIGDVRNLSTFKEQFDLVNADSILEHVGEGIDDAIKEICRLAKSFITITIINKDNGVDKTHVRIKPNKWWVNKFSEHGFKLINEEVNNQVDGNVSGNMVFARRVTPINKRVKYAILMPVYNSATTLDKCLKFIKRIDLEPNHIVFCENNSTDETMDIINEFSKDNSTSTHKKSFPDVKIIQFHLESDIFIKGAHTHTGVGMARQKLLEYARTLDVDYAIFVDSDVLVLDEDLIQKIHFRELDILGAPYYRHYPEGVYVCSIWIQPENKYQYRGATSLDLETNILTSGGLLALSRRAIHDEKLRFYPNHTEIDPLMAEDFGFCALAKKNGYVVGLDSLITVHHMIKESIKPKPWAYAEGKPVPFKY